MITHRTRVPQVQWTESYGRHELRVGEFYLSISESLEKGTYIWYVTAQSTIGIVRGKALSVKAAKREAMVALAAHCHEVAFRLRTAMFLLGV